MGRRGVESETKGNCPTSPIVEIAVAILLDMVRGFRLKDAERLEGSDRARNDL
jgi:hypothetical protein